MLLVCAARRPGGRWRGQREGPRGHRAPLESIPKSWQGSGLWKRKYRARFPEVGQRRSGADLGGKE